MQQLFEIRERCLKRRHNGVGSRGPLGAGAAGAAMDESHPAERGTLGSYSRHMGWRATKPHGAEADPTFRFRALSREA